MSNDYSFTEYQLGVDAVAKYPEVGTGSVNAMVYGVLGLNGEAGEVAEKFKKILRDKGGVLTQEDEDEILKEIGDVLWYAAALAAEMGYSLEEVAIRNLNKLNSRKERGVLNGSGDNR